MPGLKSIAGVLAFIVMVLVIFVFLKVTKSNGDLVSVHADFNVGSEEIIHEFELSEKNAGDKYFDKIISIKGTLKKISKDEKGLYTIFLGDKGSTNSILCSMDLNHFSNEEKLYINNNLTIKGNCTGFVSDELLGSDLIMNRCVLSKEVK